MNILVIALIISVLSWAFSLPIMFRAYARNRADQMISHTRQRTEKLIHRCISVLTWTNKRLTKDEEPDSRRIEQLSDLLDKIQNPHG